MDKPEPKRRGPLAWLTGRSRRFWIVAALALPVLYAASFGPVCWLTSRNESLLNVAGITYYPLAVVLDYCPDIRWGLRLYGRFGEKPRGYATPVADLVLFKLTNAGPIIGE